MKGMTLMGIGIGAAIAACVAMSASAISAADGQNVHEGIQGLRTGCFEYSGVFGHTRLRSGEHDLTFPMFPAQILNGTLTDR
jgi:hypothetical protein